jgi:hypothetical protein
MLNSMLTAAVYSIGKAFEAPVGKAVKETVKKQPKKWLMPELIDPSIKYPAR